MTMKKTDLYKNQGLAVASRIKNAAKAPKPGSAEDKVLSKKELALANPLLAYLIGKSKPKSQ
jgi:hypothetical protein